MGAFLQFAFLFVCWLAALATLLIFLESWFALANPGRPTSQRSSGAYGVISIFVPMHGPVAKIERMIRSIFSQSYPFIELFLIYSEEDRRLADLAREFRMARSHIPVRLVATPLSTSLQYDRTRVLEQAQAASRGRWLVVVDPGIVLDRFAIEMAVEFAGSNEISALALRPGVQCQSVLQKLIAPSMDYLLQVIRIGNGRREKRKLMNLESSFLLINREAFTVVNQINRLPGILNESGWNVWSYQIEGLRTFEGDASSWMWRDADVRSWSTDTCADRPFGKHAAGVVAGSVVMALTTAFGLAYGFSHRIDNFAGGSILGFSVVGYILLAISYFLFARRLRAHAWFAPLWLFSYFPASILTLLEMRRLDQRRPRIQEPRKAEEAQKGN